MAFVLKKESREKTESRDHVIKNKIGFVKTLALLFNITTTNTNSNTNVCPQPNRNPNANSPVCFAISLPRLKNKRQAKPSIS